MKPTKYLHIKSKIPSPAMTYTKKFQSLDTTSVGLISDPLFFFKYCCIRRSVIETITIEIGSHIQTFGVTMTLKVFLQTTSIIKDYFALKWSNWGDNRGFFFWPRNQQLHSFRIHRNRTIQ